MVVEDHQEQKNRLVEEIGVGCNSITKFTIEFFFFTQETVDSSRGVGVPVLFPRNGNPFLR
jgi:hypothetical protein